MEVNCEFKRLRDFQMYMCVVTSAFITKPNTIIKKFKGVHKIGKSHQDVCGILFTHLNIEFFPHGLGEQFPNLVTVFINNCNLKVIFRRDLVGLENLEHFCLNFNELKSLPSNLFVNMNKLKKVSISDNQLENLSSKLLQPFEEKNEVFFNFRRNSSIDSFFNPMLAGSEASLSQLMKVIDEKCGKPDELDVLEAFKESVMNGCKDLWMSGRFSDFLIVAGKKEFRVHKSVLATQSESFSIMFEKNKAIREMKVTDFSAESVEMVLRFMYTGEIPELDVVNTLELFSLSANCKIELLKTKSKEMVMEKLDQENALEIFTLGYQYDTLDMQQLAFDEIKKMFPGVEFSEDLMMDIASLKELVEGNRNMKRKVFEADQENQKIKRKAIEEFDEILKKCKKN